MRPDEIRPGGLVAGKYRIRTILGRGHGVLVEAFNTEFDQRVAIRLLLAGQTDDKELERFRRESRTLAKLESEHVARIIDVGTAPDGTFYLVRQFLEGTDLATYVRSRGPLPLQEAVLLVLQIAEAVSETHGHGIIFREMQPQHLFLTQRVGGAPLVKIVDFGTAKLMRDVAAPSAGEMTATTMLGVSAYSSPEIVRKSKSIDVRADVWSLGAILYFLLTARPPFEGEMAMLMLQIAREEPVPVTHHRRDLPPEIEQILGWSMAKDVDGRFANVHAFAHALRPFTTAEGQVLIDRIGQITHAAKQRKKVGSVPPPAMTQPMPVAAGRAGAQEDEGVTRIQSSAAAVGDQPLERTMYLASDYVPPSPGPQPTPPPPPAAGGAPYPGAGGAAGAGGASGPMFGGAASGMGGSVLGPSQALEPPRAPAPSWSGAGRGDPAAAPPAGHAAANLGAPVPAAPAKKNRNVLIGGLAAAAVLVPVVLVTLVVGRPKGATETADSTAPIAVTPPPPSPTTEAPAAPAPTPEPAAAPPPSSEPVAAATPPSETGTTPAKAPTPSGGGGAAAPAGGGGAAPKPTATAPSGGGGGGKTPIPTPTAAPPSGGGGGGNGTLVAVAVGGACAFSVNGAAKGTAATLKVSMAPGTYSVSCKPASGATKSRSVTIKSGETAMAMFKLQ
ncbi:serine/threonine protein kinase [Polyangium aurulentum]|uniref:serine/threonine protein kinase n=1 Tax=Polyangium aurulentum TaxID=2567896 RepID=UPI0010AEC35B|nr:serine/threonine-protein kinase [Polyangium aurulentum]UQA57993.1 serine/threonine protein kinase [Polyangium aurulentum]